MSSIPGSVGYISHVHRAYDYLVLRGSGYIWLDTKIVLKKKKKNCKTRCQGIIKKLIRTGYLGEGFANFAELCEDADAQLFKNTQTNNQHVLHQLLPPVKNSQHALRPRVHPYQIPFVSNNALRNNYIYRMLYKDIY